MGSPTARPLFGVTGATGGLGRRVAAGLAAKGAAQRLLVRDPARAPRLDGAEAAQVPAYRDAAAMRRALDGVDTLLLIPASEAPDRAEAHAVAVDAAAAAGVRRIVYVSFVNAAPDATFTFARDHWATEQRILATGLPATFLRMSLYLDMMPRFTGADGVIAGPAGGGRVGAVARDDLAATAVAVLTSGGHDGRTYDVTGPEAFTLDEAAAVLSAAAGRRITFRDETLAEARASRAGYGAPAWEVEGWVTSYAAIAAGELEVVTDTVKRLTGTAPMTLAAYLRADPHALDHVVGPGQITDR